MFEFAYRLIFKRSNIGRYIGRSLVQIPQEWIGWLLDGTARLFPVDESMAPRPGWNKHKAWCWRTTEISFHFHNAHSWVNIPAVWWSLLLVPFSTNVPQASATTGGSK